MDAVIVFDADNTIWDTNSVFKNAQISLLKKLEQNSIIIDPQLYLAPLQEIDLGLVKEEGAFEYDFKLLVAAITFFCSENLSIQAAINRAISYNPEEENPTAISIIDAAYQAYQKALKKLPKLYPDTIEVLSKIHDLKENNRIYIILLTEGDPKRLEKIISAYKFHQHGFLDEIIIEKKSLEAFENAKQIGLQHLSNRDIDQKPLLFAIGDSLRRDIKYGNQAGFITVYKPSPFMGLEEPHDQQEKPKYTIYKLGELLPLLEIFGLSFKFPEI
jgi:putative hydrolase of the HAD superfamily